jgi:uncharacterized protein YndB with AHSA1/START domain
MVGQERQPVEEAVMATVTAKAERVVQAPPAQVYALLADYRDARPQLLPESFRDYRVEAGGTGEGTLVTYRLQAARRERPYRLEVTEPEPGRMLRESDTESSFVTTWTVTPAEGGTRVRIESAWSGAGGVGGFFERLFAPRGLGRRYDDILSRLERTLASP